MAKANTGNAHIRSDSQRQSAEAQAGEAQRLLDDPAFNRAYDAVREGLMTEIESYKHNGQPESENYERELCRTLRTLKSLRRALSLGVQGQRLRLADYQSATSKPE